MKNLIILSILCLFSGFSIAQSPTTDYMNKVVTCETYDSYSGIPNGISKNWIVSSSGSNVYVVYNSSSSIKEALSLEVKKKNSYSGSYDYYGSYYMSYENSNPKKWAMYDLKFKEAGDYSLTVKNSKGKTLAETITNITIDDEQMKKDNNKTFSSEYYDDDDDDDASDTYYYENSKIQLGKGVTDNGDIIDENSTFYLRGGTASIAVLLTQDNAFKTDIIYVDLYDAGTSKKINSFTFENIGKEWNWIKVSLEINKRGKYYVDIYNHKDTFVNSSDQFEVK